MIHPKFVKKSKVVLIWEYCLGGFVTPSDHCALRVWYNIFCKFFVDSWLNKLSEFWKILAILVKSFVIVDLSIFVNACQNLSIFGMSKNNNKHISRKAIAQHDSGQTKPNALCRW